MSLGPVVAVAIAIPNVPEGIVVAGAGPVVDPDWPSVLGRLWLRGP
jgi:zinc transporter ZupT